MVEKEQQSREIMSSLYQINRRMIDMSKRRDVINNRIIEVENRVRTLNRQVSALEADIRQQQGLLSKRLRAIYMLGQEGVARVLFSSASAHDLDQSLKFLKKISDRDYRLIKSYQKNLSVLKSKKARVNVEADRLARIQMRLQRQENLLTVDHQYKAKILSDIKKLHEGALEELGELRAQAIRQHIIDAYDLSFFEQKGQLSAPVQGELIQDYSLLEHPMYGYRISHKGHTYSVAPGSSVFPVYRGRVAFAGDIPGYGSTVVVSHGDHYYTVYANANQIMVSEGQLVEAKESIAKCNSRLYFEIRHFSDPINPKFWIKNAKI